MVYYLPDIHVCMPDKESVMNGNSGVPEIMVLFGVPLRVSFDKHIYNARIVEKSGSSLQVPAGYKKIDK